TAIENVLQYTTLKNAPNWPGSSSPNGFSGTSFAATSAPVLYWFEDNFTYPTLAQTTTNFTVSPPHNPFPNLRPVLVTRNGVSNLAPANSPSTTVLTVPNAAMTPSG